MRLLIMTVGIGMTLLGPVWAASGKIAASPNPCGVAPGGRECTSYITWSSQGATRVRVYLTAMGKKNVQEKEFAAANSCEGQKCPASWIEEGTNYIFTLYDYSSGNRGKVLSSVSVTGTKMGGTISASPNPCRIVPGTMVCTSYLTWSAEGVEHARVYVEMEGKTVSPEKEFADGRHCVAQKCPAPWIEAGTKYRFTLYDSSNGTKGRPLATVTVAATK